MALGLKRKGFESQLDVTQEVLISDIKTDTAHQHRAKIDPRVVEDYAEVLRGGGELAPVKLIRDGADLWLWDGHQTLEAAKIAGTSRLRAEIKKGTKRDAWKKSLGANYKHGARRTRDDLAKAIRSAITDRELRYSLLAEDGEYTYTSVAKLVRTSKTSIRNHWQKYVAEEVHEEIDETLRQYSDMIVSQKEMAKLVAKELHIPSWIVEQRQIEVAFNLSQLSQKLEESELVAAPDKVTEPSKIPATSKAPDKATGPSKIPATSKIPDKATGTAVAETPATSKAPDKAIGTAVAEAPDKTTGAMPTPSNDNDEELDEDENIGALQPQSSNDESFFKRPRRDFNPELPIYQWDPLRRAAISPEELEELITTIRMAGGSIMEVNDASELHIDAKIGKEREVLPSLPDVWGGNTYYVIKLKVEK